MVIIFVWKIRANWFVRVAVILEVFSLFFYFTDKVIKLTKTN